MLEKNQSKAAGLIFFARKGMIQVLIILLFAVIVSASVIHVKSGEKSASKTNGYETGIISVNTMKTFGKLTEPEVRFPHDNHTDILISEGDACVRCHSSEGKTINFSFMAPGASDRDSAMDSFHDKCITCHETSETNTAPVACRDCHSVRIESKVVHSPFGFDRSLHFRHEQTAGGKCGTCHHEYSETEKKLIYKEGNETTCRHCHAEVAEKDKTDLKSAFHSSCINCHINTGLSGKTTGPVNCRGCHDPENQAKIKKISDIPRLKRGQPDLVTLVTGKKTVDQKNTGRMDFVPFDHRLHEDAETTCRVCHHNHMKSCNNCHTLEGSADGNGINLEKAMHTTAEIQSCVGCHETEKKETECIGCHDFIGGDSAASEDTCRVCHNGIGLTAKANNQEKIRPYIEKRQGEDSAKILSQIPDIVKIDRLADEFQGSLFPHRKIVTTLVKGADKSRLAGGFHREPTTVCQGCHHNQPATDKPSSCVTCHKSETDTKTGKPGLKGAYHIQCMSCHDLMNIEKNGCTDCHKER